MGFGLPILALLAIATVVLGTERLGRPLTDDEKRRFGALLREHDYPGMRLVALRFAYRLTRSTSRAQELLARVDLRLVRLGWDPDEVSLVKCLCRFVWSEWTHASRESATTRRGETAYYRELEATEGVSVDSIERRAVEREAQSDAQALAKAHLDKLRAMFEKAGDEVNLFWLDSALAGETDLQTMAASSGRAVDDFYTAAKRRKRAVTRLLAEDRGVEYEEEKP
jgi:hypothetical protein